MSGLFLFVATFFFFVSPALYAADALPTLPALGSIRWEKDTSKTQDVSCPTICENNGFLPVVAGKTRKGVGPGGLEYYVCRWDAASEGNRPGYSYSPTNKCEVSYNDLPAVSTSAKECQCITKPVSDSMLWVDSDSRNCGLACYSSQKSAVISGGYSSTGTPFYVCRGKTLAVGGVSGFNVAPNWQNACYTGFSPAGETSYMCQCNPAY